MTSAVEFTYLYDFFSLSVNESTLNRAVRVKNTVKDKILRVFKSKEVVVSNDNVAIQPEIKDSLIDLSEEKKVNLNNAMNALQTQRNVSYSPNRAVLFTQPLVAKIFRVTGKWFDGMPIAEKKEEQAFSDIPSVNMINHLGGEVVPGNWSSVQENTNSLEPTLEVVPNIETEKSADQSVQNVNIEIPSVSEHTDIYKFPSFDFNMESVAPSVTPVSQNDETGPVSFDFVSEPKQLNEVDKQDFVPEPSVVSSSLEIPSNQNNDFSFNIPSFESSVNVDQNTSATLNDITVPVAESTVVQVPNVGHVASPVSLTVSETESKINDLLNKEFIPNPLNNFVPEHIDNRPAEVKIDEFLGRNVPVQENVSAEENVNQLNMSTSSNVQVEKPEITQAHILARLQRVNNTMADKDTAIRNLTAKNEALKEEAAASREKVAEYETRFNDLTAKNSDLVSQNERLTAKFEEVETSSNATIAKLETKLEEVTQSKTEEIASLRKMLDELREKHASEISAMKEKHAAELKTVNDSKEKQIQAIYSTISEALGDPVLDEDYSRGMAA